MAAYNVAKAGVIALSDTLASELADAGVGVTVLCPSFFQTRIASSGRYTDAQARELAEKLVSRGPSAELIAQRAIQAVEGGKLYCFPTAEARTFSRLKRLFPAGMGRIFPVLDRLNERLK